MKYASFLVSSLELPASLKLVSAQNALSDRAVDWLHERREGTVEQFGISSPLLNFRDSGIFEHMFPYIKLADASSVLVRLLFNTTYVILY